MSSKSRYSRLTDEEEGQADAIDIRILAPEQKYHNITISASASVQTLKEEICQLTEIPVDNQRLIYSGKILADAKQLKEYSLSTGDVVHLFPRPTPAAGNAAAGTTAGGAEGQASSSQSITEPITRTFHVLSIAGSDIEHLPIHFEPTIMQASREVRMLSLILLLISSMRILGGASIIVSGQLANELVIIQALNVVDLLTSVASIVTAMLGIRSSTTLDLQTIQHYVRWLMGLAVAEILLQFLWVASVVVQAKQQVEEQKAEGDDDATSTDDEAADVPVLNDSFVIYMGVQAAVVAMIFIVVWISCVRRAVTFQAAVQNYAALELR